MHTLPQKHVVQQDRGKTYRLKKQNTRGKPTHYKSRTVLTPYGAETEDDAVGFGGYHFNVHQGWTILTNLWQVTLLRTISQGSVIPNWNR